MLLFMRTVRFCPSSAVHFVKTDLNDIKFVTFFYDFTRTRKLANSDCRLVMSDSPSVYRGKKNPLPINGFS